MCLGQKESSFHVFRSSGGCRKELICFHFCRAAKEQFKLLKIFFTKRWLWTQKENLIQPSRLLLQEPVIGRRKGFSPPVSTWVSLIGWDGRWLKVSGARWTLEYFLVLWPLWMWYLCVDTLYVNILFALVMCYKDELDVLQKSIRPGFVKMKDCWALSMLCVFHLLCSSSSLVLF